MTRMKESGIDWIGQIPEEWEVDFVNHIFEEHKQKNKGNKEKNLLSLSYGRIIRKSIDTSFGLLPESFDTYNIIQRGDIVLRLTDLQNDKRSLRVGLARENGIITSAYLTLRLKNICCSDSYMYYLLHTYDICKVFYNFGGGVRQGGTWSDIYKMELLIPPKNEQQKIADFLDKKTAQLDKVKALLEEQIQKLKDYRASLIYETVTKGLDKTVPMKDSGIDWIGQVPQGWEMVKFKYFFNTSKGLSITKECLVDEGIPVINYGQIHSSMSKQVQSCDVRLPFVPDYYLSKKGANLNQGDFVFADTSEDLEGAGNFSTRIDSTGPLLAGYHTIIARLNNYDEYDFRYFMHLFDSLAIRKQIQNKVSGIKVYSITQGILNSIFVIIPPKSEQQKIANLLDEKTAQIDKLVQIKNQQIENINKQRQTLIYDYVTGKRRV